MTASISNRVEGDVLVIAFRQEELFDGLVEPCREIFDRAFSAGNYKIVLDMNDAENMDSFFLAMLVLLYKEVTSNGGAVKLVSVSERLGEILDRVRFRRLFDSYDTVDRALASFAEVN